MKNLLSKSISFLTLISLLFVFSCGDDDSPDNTDNTAPGTMTCKVDGTQWTSATATATILNGIMNITGVSSDDQVFTITLDGDSEGSYSLDPSLQNVIAHTIDTNGSNPAYVSNQNTVNTNFGVVTVSEIDTDNKTISGTFQTEVHRIIDGEVKIITEGVFEKIPYVESVAPTSSTLSADIDGTTFNATSVTGVIAFGMFTINGSDGTGSKTIALTIPPDIAAGTYNLTSPGFSDYGAQYNADANTFLTADSGTLIITEHNTTSKEIKGTFDFEASDFVGSASASLSNGVFELSY